MAVYLSAREGKEWLFARLLRREGMVIYQSVSEGKEWLCICLFGKRRLGRLSVS